MASTYSTNLGLELITTGEQAGTWGTTTNLNLGTLIEQAISGYVTQAITDGADTVITIPDGASGVARNMFIEMTGALTATRNLIVPADKKLYFIYNNTTGGFAVTVKVTGLTGVSVPNGRKVILVCNGTDIVEAHNAVSGNATVGGTLVVTGATTAASFSGAGTGLTGTAASLTAGNATTAAACSGNAATATTSAALTNGGTLNTPGSGTLTNCTGYPAASISGLGTGVATFLATPSSANLAAAVTGETGSGALVFATSPTLVTPALGTPSSGNLSSCTNLPIDAGTTGTLPPNRGGTGVTAASTGTGGVVLSNSPSLTSPALGTPSSGNLSNCTNFPTLNQNTTGSSGSCTGNSATATTASALTGSAPIAGAGAEYPDAANYMGVSDNSIGFGYSGSDVYVSVDNSAYGTFISLSDYRIKKDVRTLSSNATYITNAIRVVDYEVLELDGTQAPERVGIRRAGVIAHEIQELIPNAASGKKDAVNADGSPSYQSVNYNAVVPFLIKTIQELTARIEKLEG